MRSASCVGSQVLTVPPAANRATAMYARERGQTRRMVLRREHDNLQDVLRYYRHQLEDLSAGNDAIRAAVQEKTRQRNELAHRNGAHPQHP